MRKFFRNIRQHSLSENRFGKYLIYAVGEILIVIIGILIAIQINNWNERQKNEKKIVSLLREIKKNLIDEIKVSQSVIEFYNGRDSLLRLVMANKISRQDFESKSEHCPQFAITTWNYIEINRNAYNNLILISSEIPSEYESLYESLQKLYDVDGNYVTERKVKLYSQMTDFFKYLKVNKEWYSNMFMSEKLDDDAIEFFMQNPFYKNYVFEYLDDALKLQDAIIKYKNQAELVCNKITEQEKK
jgi:hypothetical protein